MASSQSDQKALGEARKELDRRIRELDELILNTRGLIEAQQKVKTKDPSELAAKLGGLNKILEDLQRQQEGFKESRRISAELAAARTAAEVSRLQGQTASSSQSSGQPATPGKGIALRPPSGVVGPSAPPAGPEHAAEHPERDAPAGAAGRRAEAGRPG